MPDIAMCRNVDCPRAKECYRHEAEPSELRQSYAGFYYGPNGCDYFMTIWKTPQEQEDE